MNRLQSLSWGRIGAESVSIVASILLAFAINAWWQNRQTQSLVQESLVALRGELAGNLGIIGTELSYRNAAIASGKTLVTSSDRENLSPEPLDHLLGDLSYLGRSAFSTGALQSILQGGLLADIEDGELRRLLAGLPAQYEFVRQFEETNTEFTFYRLEPYIDSHGSFTQLANATAESGRPGTGEFKEELSYVVPEHVDHAALLQSNEFMGILTQDVFQYEDVANALERLREKIDQAIELIDRLTGLRSATPARGSSIPPKDSAR
jgi:hypothetical protein